MEIMKSLGKSWNCSWRQPCSVWSRIASTGETCGDSDNRKSKRACVVEAHKSTRKRLERTPPKDHEDHIAERGFNLVHKSIPMPQSNENP